MQKRSSIKYMKRKEKSELNQKIIDSIVKENEAKHSKRPFAEKNMAAVLLGRLGGLKGGKARAEKLTAEQRSEIAKKAALTRWSNKK